ncbi:Hsp20/alpha crystallin family protein [Candidatus Bathyarchaeota archaeon]|nr:Hsp20/alpha crystallin family protein [Candidatus Bathyarchaeota archaeon]
MSEDESWWRRRRRYPFDIFEEFEQIMNEMMQKVFRNLPKEFSQFRPYIYGYSFSLGPDGKPVIREFGNVQPTEGGPKIKEKREPLVDIMEEKDELVVFAEVPGVEKEEINLNSTEETLIINVDTEKRKYYKEVELPTAVDPKSAKATYKNGVLEVRFKKVSGEKEKGRRIPIE